MHALVCQTLSAMMTKLGPFCVDENRSSYITNRYHSLSRTGTPFALLLTKGFLVLCRPHHEGGPESLELQ